MVNNQLNTFCRHKTGVFKRQKLMHAFSIKLKVFKSMRLDSKSFFVKNVKNFHVLIRLPIKDLKNY